MGTWFWQDGADQQVIHLMMGFHSISYNHDTLSEPKYWQVHDTMRLMLLSLLGKK